MNKPVPIYVADVAVNTNLDEAHRGNRIDHVIRPLVFIPSNELLPMHQWSSALTLRTATRHLGGKPFIIF